MARRPINYGRQFVDEEDIAAVADVLRSEFLTQGPAVERFEAAVAERVGARHAVAASSGTAALHIACLAAGMKPGTVGLTQALTFVATANAILYCGADAKTVDVDPKGLSLSPEAVSAAVSGGQEPNLVMPVHFSGLAWRSDEIRRAAPRAVIIEDACHAFGARYADGQVVGCGRYADMSVFSFHPVKSITTGEGGLVATNDAEIARRLRLFRNHGIERSAERFIEYADAFEEENPRPWYYEQHALGFNYRMTDFQAALGLSQLKKLDRFLTRRREIAERYDEAFGKNPFIDLVQAGKANRSRSANHLYVLLIDYAALGTTRAKFMSRLRDMGIGTQVHYIPIYRQPFYKRVLACESQQFPATESFYVRCLSIPLHPGLTDEEVQYVIEAVNRTAANDRRALR